METKITDSYRFAIVGLTDQPFRADRFNMHWIEEE